MKTTQVSQVFKCGQLFLRLPKNFDKGTGPSSSSLLLLLECLLLDLCFFSLLDLLELDLDLLDSSSSLLDDSEDELEEELESDECLLERCKYNVSVSRSYKPTTQQ